MRDLLKLYKARCLIALILASVFLPSTIAQSLSNSEIEALKMQLVKAGDIQNAVSARVQCYVEQDNDLQTRSSKLQNTAGDLHRVKRELSKKLVKLKSEAEAFRRDFAAAQQKMHGLKKQVNYIEVKIHMEQASLDACKKEWWTPNFLCDVTGEIVGLNADMRKLTAEKNAFFIKLNSLQQQLIKAETLQNQANEQYSDTQNMLDKTKQNITTSEMEIKVLKASLAEIRIVKHDYATELFNFENAFSEFEALNLGSDRRSMVRRLRSESAALDGLLLKAQSLLDKKGLQLPSGQRICAN
jgi:predicted  nucleic acid-binding Zn-ribbon protein